MSAGDMVTLLEIVRAASYLRQRAGVLTACGVRVVQGRVGKGTVPRPRGTCAGQLLEAVCGWWRWRARREAGGRHSGEPSVSHSPTLRLRSRAALTLYLCRASTGTVRSAAAPPPGAAQLQRWRGEASSSATSPGSGTPTSGGADSEAGGSSSVAALRARYLRNARG